MQSPAMQPVFNSSFIRDMRVLKAKSTPLKQPKRHSISSEARMLQWLFQVIQLLQQLTAHHHQS